LYKPNIGLLTNYIQHWHS